METRTVGISDRTLAILESRGQDIMEIDDGAYAAEVDLLKGRWSSAPANLELDNPTVDVRKVSVSDRTLRALGEDALGLPAWHPARVEVIILMGRYHRAVKPQPHRVAA